MDLFSSHDITGVHFKNRCIMAPMVLNCAGLDGSVTQAFRDFYMAGPDLCVEALADILAD